MNNILGQKDILSALEKAIEHDLPALLIGETGTGKTEMIKMLAHKNSRPVIRYNVTGETTVDEIVGRYELIDGTTRWQDGVVIQAMRQGAWLLIDEVNLALPEVIMTLQSLLDDSKEIRLAQHQSEVITPSEGFRFFATMNPTEGYAGTKPLNRAFLSRYPIVINVDYPSRNDEVKILTKNGLKAEEAQMMLDIAIISRNKKQQGDINYQVSTRELLQYAKLRNAKIAAADALELAIINKAQGQDRQSLKRIAGEVTGDYLEVKKQGYEPTIASIKKEIAKIEDKKKELERSRERIKEEVAAEILKSLKTPTSTDSQAEEVAF